ncbi:MAG: hypothetical protein ABI772_15295 [Bacteroidota bacterium]
MNSFISKLLMLLLITFSASAQTTSTIAGKWKVKAVDNGVICDYKTNTIGVKSELTVSLTGNPDSLKVIELFTYVAKSYLDYIFYFHKDGIYEEIQNGEKRNPLASYYLNEAEHLVNIRPAKDDPAAELQSMMYDLSKDGILTLTLAAKDKKMVLSLEKMDE